jgi:hypothetical protein
MLIIGINIYKCLYACKLSLIIPHNTMKYTHISFPTDQQSDEADCYYSSSVYCKFQDWLIEAKKERKKERKKATSGHQISLTIFQYK